MTQYVNIESNVTLQYANGEWINSVGIKTIDQYHSGLISVTEFVMKMASEGYHISSVSDKKVVILVTVCDGRVTLAVEVEKCKQI